MENFRGLVSPSLHLSQILKTKEVSNSDRPIFNEWTELLTEGFVGSELVFKLDDNDVWPNSDDPIGATSLKLTEVYFVNLCFDRTLSNFTHG